MSPAASAVVVYTDGACAGNPGPGGWAWATAPDGARRGSGGEARSTNQRMEIRAVLEALRSLDGPLTIVSDSTYVVNCFRDKWYVRWQANGWKNAQKAPVANVDLWKPLIELVLARAPEFRWVKGHSGDPMNDLVDELAVLASKGPFNVPPVLPAGMPADVAAASATTDHDPEDGQGSLFDA